VLSSVVMMSRTSMRRPGRSSEANRLPRLPRAGLVRAVQQGFYCSESSRRPSEREPEIAAERRSASPLAATRFELGVQLDQPRHLLDEL
jgi:hypothetical protein